MGHLHATLRPASWLRRKVLKRLCAPKNISISPLIDQKAMGLLASRQRATGRPPRSQRSCPPPSDANDRANRNYGMNGVFKGASQLKLRTATPRSTLRPALSTRCISTSNCSWQKTVFFAHSGCMRQSIGHIGCGSRNLCQNGIEWNQYKT